LIKIVYLTLAAIFIAVMALAGWMVGSPLWSDDASAALQKTDLLPPVIPLRSNEAAKQDRLAPETSETSSASLALETARLYVLNPATRAVSPVVAKPERPTNALLNDAQIAGIKSRLKLSSAQARYWPEVEAALKDVVQQIYDTQRRNRRSGSDTVDLDTPEIKRLRVAAIRLFEKLDQSQKNEIISLARMAGMGSAVSGLSPSTQSASEE